MAGPKVPQDCLYARLGEVDYSEAWDMQSALARRRADGETPDSLLLLEHPHTYTLGRRAIMDDVLASDGALARLGVRVVHADRGGLVTYHGPGQIVVYPIMDVRPPAARGTTSARWRRWSSSRSTTSALPPRGYRT